ncbi:hypothetical protein CEP52_010215 [Fusarium oligoseptatum]|uniref:Uncharacterized protein n=1 Tax=Fusarium oligoseptatum TaxID=2604345 RepID=A0A428T9G9_9HYPO|nr:hypothetical protein CEP52_010215 [Fusarium oligoseptatum]
MSSGEAPPANPTPPVNPAPSRPRGIPPHEMGENPTIEERRAYMGVYLNWMVEGSAESERQARKKAEEAATIKFAQEGKTEVKTTIFEWAVDRIYWDIWFEAYSSIAGQPPYPWRRPEENPNEPCSDTFARILGQRRNREQERQRQQQHQQRQAQCVRRRRAGSFEEPQSSQRRRLEAPAREDVVFLTAMNQILSDSFWPALRQRPGLEHELAPVPDPSFRGSPIPPEALQPPRRRSHDGLVLSEIHLRARIPQ